MNRRRPITTALPGLLLAAACGPALAPAGLGQFEAEWAAADTGLLAEVAPESFAEAADWLELARAASSARRSDAAERFAHLGVIALRTAALHLARLETAERARSVENEIAELERELERLEDALDLARREEERARLSSHLEAVVDEVRRQAAADEEARDARLAPEERTALQGARLAIAVEIEARARLTLGVLLALAEAGVLIAEQSIPVRNDIERAAGAVAAGDLAAAQEHCENAGVYARRMIEDAFAAGGGDFPGQVAGLLAAAREIPGWEDRATAEDLGVGIGLPLRFTAKGALERGSNERVGEIGRLLGDLPGVAAVLVVAAHGRSPATPAVAARADLSARAVADALRPALSAEEPGIPVLPVAGVGGASPIAPLRGRGVDRAALLLIPQPAGAALKP